MAVRTASSSDPILTVVGQPDLKVTSLTYPAGISYVGGDTIPMSLTYTNRIDSDGTKNVPYVPGSIHAANFRIEVVLSSNPTFGDTDDFLLTAHVVGARINADGVDRTINWTQLLPGNFTGSYYVLAKMDALEAVEETTEDSFTDNGNNIWYDINGSRIALDPSNFPTIFWGSSEGDNWSDQPTNNEDGRYTVYASDATNLVTGDGNAKRDVFIYDQQTLTIRRLSASQQGTEGNGASQSPFISADSTAVAFSSEATNLILGDTNGFSDIYVVKSFTGEISRVNVRDDATQANGSSFRPALSQDGQFVVFESTASNLIAGGTTVGVTHIYRRDNTAGTISLVSVDSGGGNQGNGNSTQARVSADGRYVVFASDATNLVAGDTNATRDIFLRDMTNDTTVRVSVSSGGTEGNGASRSPSISADGAHVAFHSLASNLVAGDTNGVSDVFSHTVAASTTVRVSVSTAGTEATDPSGGGFELGSINPSISSTGRFVAFSSMANNLTDGDALGQYQATDANGALDVFVRDRDVSESGTFDTPGNVVTVMVSRNRFGFQTARLLGIPSTAASDIFPAISADGRWVTFPSDAENTAGLVHGANNRTSPDLNTFRDVFVHDRRINALPNPSNDPTVSLTAPVDGSSIFIGSTLTVVGSATAPAGTVASVEFYVNGLSLGQITTAPYTVDWTPTVAGSYTLSALVVDSFGNQGVSTNVTVSVTTVSPSSPVVTLDNPSNGATVTVNSSTTLQATASDPDGTIALVEFYANGLSLGSDSTFPYTINWFPTALGSVSLTAEATDLGGNSATSTAAAVTVSSIVVGGPTVAVTNPTAGATLAVNAAATINATATDADGTITSVQFFANGTSIGTDTTFPFAVSWTPVSEGAVSLSAQATDNEAKVGESVAVTVTISGGGAPVVSITSPAGGDTIPVNTTAFVTATATDADGTITGVEFFANGLSLGSDTVFPFTAAWAPTSTGPTSLTAVATDNTGNVTTSTTVSVTVGAVSAGTPSVAISSPASGSSVLVNQTATVEATASDPDGSIAQVDFYLNGLLLGSDTTFPYSTTWTPVSLGSFALVATATDDEGTMATSTTNTVTVSGGGVPTVSLTAPAGGASFDIGSTVAVTSTATAVSPAAVTSVQFLANGEEIGTDTTAPYALDWKPVQAGDYTLTAVVTDSLGTSVTSASVAVTMATTTTVTVNSPADSTAVLVNTAATVEATATDTAGTIAQVDFFANGVSLGSDTTFPYAITWTPVALGSYAITAVATDDEGNLTASTSNIVTASAGGVPTVSVTAPAGGTSFDIGSTISVTASSSAVSPRSVTLVQFFVDGAEIGQRSAAPYSVDWKPIQAGTFTLTSVVTDNFGISATSAAVSVTFNSTTSVTVDSPANGSLVPVNAAITVTATASDSAGTIEEVEFLANGVSLGTDSTFPYSATWTPVALGSYTIVATATDDGGNTTSSTPNVVTVSAGNPPTVAITNPATGAVVAVNSPTTISATANDVGGTIAQVEFFADGNSLATDTTFPYSVSWTSNVTGSISLTAAATDDTGNVTMSAAVLVSVAGGAAPVATLTAPAAGSSYVVGNPITLTASASATFPATIATVRFLANSALINADASSPYTTTWTPTSPGTYALVAEVTDTLGNIASSPVRTVTITENAPPTVSLTNPASNQVIQLGAGVLLSALASDPDGLVTSVAFRANGIPLATDTTVPYSFSWLPTSAGSYTVTAVATDNVGNVVSSAGRIVTVQSAAAPTVVLTGPLDGQTFLVGSPVQVSASATAAAGVIAQVEFLVNGASLVGPNNPDLVAPFATTWIPTAAGNYTFAAVATDTAGQSTISSQVTVIVQPNAAPAVSMVSPTSGTVLTAGTPITLIGAATDTDGTVTSVSFLANGLLVGTSTQPPYSFAWTPGAAGTYALEARAVDNSGNVTGSTAVNVTVVSNGAPTVTITSPGQGKSVQLGSATTLRAVATDSGGNITDVTFYANGVALGSDATAPYEVSFNPPANGVYRLVATATDNGGQLSSSAEVFVAVVNPSEDDTETIYTGSYVAGSETGTFTIARKAAISATFVARSDSNPAKIYYYDGISVDAGGNFTLVSAGTTEISGTFGPAGLSGKFDHDRAIMIGVISLPVSSYTGPVGVIHGSLSAQSDSAFVAIVAPDGRLTFHASHDSRSDVGYGTFNSDGHFSAAMVGGGQMSGRVEAATGFLTGSATGGSISGSLIGAVSSATPASDGFLRNLSTRGFVGSGDQILVAGFVVNGVAPKRVLVRAIGPTLANFGVPGVVTDPTLKLYRGSVVVGSNDDWGTDPAVPAASSTVGAFALPAGSADSALVATLVPGPYTAQVTGVNGATGVGLVEIYDVDSQLAFSSEKMLNVSTRGRVGPEELIAGVIINGVTPKRLLIRAVGPTLSDFGVSGVLADPVLRLVNQETGLVVRENNDWQMGNDALTVSKAAARVGAFALPPASKDAVLLITLPPGRYTALVSSRGGTSGIAIVEVYEIP